MKFQLNGKDCEVSGLKMGAVRIFNEETGKNYFELDPKEASSFENITMLVYGMCKNSNPEVVLEDIDDFDLTILGELEDKIAGAGGNSVPFDAKQKTKKK